MPRKIDLITELYQDTLKRVSKDSTAWKDFLTTAAFQYKYSFDDQILIHAQRPRAIACAEIDLWNKHFGRRVKRGSTGIALIVEKAGHSYLRHVFDVGDTYHPQRQSFALWELSPNHEAAIIESLENRFGALSGKDNLSVATMFACINAVEDHMNDYFENLKSIVLGSALENAEEDELIAKLRVLLTGSVVYTVFTRLGLDAEKYIGDHMIAPVAEFDTADTISCLGYANADISEMCLRQIERTVRNLERDKAKDNHTFDKTSQFEYNRDEKQSTQGGKAYGDHIHDEKRYEDSRIDASRTTSGRDRQIRENAIGVSQNTSQGDLRRDESQRNIEATPSGNRQNSDGDGGRDDQESGERRRRDRIDEIRESAKVGAIDEQLQADGGGNNSERSDFHITSNKQLPQPNRDVILEALRHGKYLREAKYAIVSFLRSERDEEKKTAFVKGVYPMDTFVEFYKKGTEEHIGYHPTKDGLEIYFGKYLTHTHEVKLSWEKTKQLIEALIRDNNYLDAPEPGQQLLILDEKPQNILPAQSQLCVSQEVIDNLLRLGGCTRRSAQRIYGFYRRANNQAENIAFLKREYETDAIGMLIDDRKVSAKWDENGIRISQGEYVSDELSAFLPWETVDKRIRELLELGQYIPLVEAESAQAVWDDYVGEKITSLYRDVFENIPNEYKTQLERGSWDEKKAFFLSILKDSQKLLSFLNEIQENVMRLKEYPPRFRIWTKPEDVYSLAATYLRDPVDFSPADPHILPPKRFTTRDQIDRQLIQQYSSVEHGKYRIYSYFLMHKNPKERIKFLVDEYGTGGASGGRIGNDHSSKGLVVFGGLGREDSAAFLKWSQVAKRIDELIREDKYLTDKEISNLDNYEKWQLTRYIQSAFESQIHDTVHQKRDEMSPYDTEKRIKEQIMTALNNPASVENIVAIMQSEYDQLPEDKYNRPYRKEGLEAMKAYAAGKYNLFPGSHFRKRVKRTVTVEESPKEENQPTIFDEQITDEYDLHLGTEVHIGTTECIINSMTVEKVELFDGTIFPLELDTETFLKRLRENPLNNHLKIQKEPTSKAEVTSAEEKTPIAPPLKPIVSVYDSHPDVLPAEKHNYRITDNEIGMGGAKAKFRKNIDAIKLLYQLEAEDRLATPEEQEVLAQYSGWGGLADAFDSTKDNWHLEYNELKNLLSYEEYEAANESTLTAFYTPPTVIRAMYNALENMGFKRGNILEPSCGVGNFMGLLPESMDAKMYGVELDSISGRIARQLYQKNGITIDGYEKTHFPDSFFDVAIGNVPFNDFKLLDKKYDKYNFLIHDYFFAKTLDKVRPGGVIAFITSSGTLDKENPSVRKYISQRADFLGAIRLPNNAFDGAGAKMVVSDIIFLQKRDRIIERDEDWVHLGVDENGIRMNQYFIDNPDMVLGEMVMRSGQYGPEPTCRAYEDEDLGKLLAEAVSNIHAEISEVEIEELSEDGEDKSIPADPTVKNFSFTIVDGRVYYRQNSVMNPVETSVTGENRIKGMIGIRDTVKALIEAQLEDYPESEIKALQSKLNRQYDEFTAKYGLINSRGNAMAFSDDNSYFLLCSLEILDENKELKAKADMFTKRTIKPQVTVDRVDTASEALALSIGERAMVDMEYMSELTGKTEEELFADLKGVIFRNPEHGEVIGAKPYLMADEYLSGNVREKLKKAKWKAEVDPEFAVNAEALERVQPVDLTAAEIGVRLGTTWIPETDVQAFMQELLGMSYYTKQYIQVKYIPQTAQWVISNKTKDLGNVKANNTYGTHRINAYEIIEQTLNLKDVRIFDYYYDEDGNKKQVLNKKETAIAQGKQEQIKRAFDEWIWKDPARRERLCKLYNERFNSLRPREFDGSHIKFYGMNPEITLRKHQSDAVARIMYGGNSLLAHVVGAGKTFTMVAAAQESKRLGLCSKSMFVVPNHLIEQWASEYLQLYPSANILVATKKDFETKNRKKFCARIATGDYDAVIIGHSQFEKIPMSLERQIETLNNERDQILQSIEEIQASRGDRVTVKQLAKARKQIETKLAKLNDQSRKDDVVTFEELGVDRLFVDEAHFYKNLTVYTKMRNVAGISQTEAQKSSDLYMKCRYLDKLTGGKGCVFATGTPISNTMVELYTMQKYLQYEELQLRGLLNFDAWASTFGETVTAIELAPDGSGYRSKTRFAKFFNIPELMAMFKQTADIQTADMLSLPVPEAHYHIVKVEASEDQKKLVESFAERAERVHNRMVSSTEDNMLLITNDGRKAALDQRLVDIGLGDYDGSKVNTCVQNIYEIWEKYADKKAAQLVFCDLSTPKDDGSFNVYDDIRNKLIERGIPPEEIAFIHAADTDTKKKELFAKVRRGQVRVLMGSTFKMGAGTNVQQRLIALHDLDVPWRPADLEQRAGRIVRQGNSNPEVDLYRYVTEGTFDAYSYQLLESKQKFISQIMTSKSPVRSAEDVDETALSYAEIKALASGNPKIMEKMQLDADVAKLKLQKADHLSQRYGLEDALIKKFPREIAEQEERIKSLIADMETAKNNTFPNENGFSPMVIMGTTYTEKAEAGKAILAICERITNPEGRPLGEYRGFKTDIGFDTGQKEFFITLRGELFHKVPLGKDPHGIITRLDNAIEAFEKRKQGCEFQLEELYKQVENAKAEIAKPFPREAELDEKCKRLAELNAELNMDRRENEIVDCAEEQGEEAQDKRTLSRDGGYERTDWYHR